MSQEAKVAASVATEVEPIVVGSGAAAIAAVAMVRTKAPPKPEDIIEIHDTDDEDVQDDDDDDNESHNGESFRQIVENPAARAATMVTPMTAISMDPQQEQALEQESSLTAATSNLKQEFFDKSLVKSKSPVDSRKHAQEDEDLDPVQPAAATATTKRPCNKTPTCQRREPLLTTVTPSPTRAAANSKPRDDDDALSVDTTTPEGDRKRAAKTKEQLEQEEYEDDSSVSFSPAANDMDDASLSSFSQPGRCTTGYARAKVACARATTASKVKYQPARKLAGGMPPTIDKRAHHSSPPTTVEGVIEWACRVGRYCEKDGSIMPPSKSPSAPGKDCTFAEPQEGFPLVGFKWDPIGNRYMPDSRKRPAKKHPPAVVPRKAIPAQRPPATKRQPGPAPGSRLVEERKRRIAQGKFLQPCDIAFPASQIVRVAADSGRLLLVDGGRTLVLLPICEPKLKADGKSFLHPLGKVPKGFKWDPARGFSVYEGFDRDKHLASRLGTTTSASGAKATEHVSVPARSERKRSSQYEGRSHTSSVDSQGRSTGPKRKNPSDDTNGHSEGPHEMASSIVCQSSVNSSIATAKRKRYEETPESTQGATAMPPQPTWEEQRKAVLKCLVNRSVLRQSLEKRAVASVDLLMNKVGVAAIILCKPDEGCPNYKAVKDIIEAHDGDLHQMIADLLFIIPDDW